MKFLKITKPYRLKDYKFSLVILVLAISCLGVLVIGSANEAYRKADHGSCAGYHPHGGSLPDRLRVDCNFYWILYLLSVGMLALVLVIGETVNGAKRWIDVGLQTSSHRSWRRFF